MSTKSMLSWCLKFSVASLRFTGLFMLAFAAVARAQTPVYNLTPEQRLSPAVVHSLQAAAEARRRQDTYERPDLRPEEPSKPLNPLESHEAEENARALAEKAIRTVVLPPTAFQSLPDDPANHAAMVGTEPNSALSRPQSFWYHGVMTGLVLGGAFLLARKLYRLHE